MAIRLALGAHHYRRPWQWSDQLIDDAVVRLGLWRGAGEGDAGLDEVRLHLDDDLDVPAALQVIDEAARSGGGVGAAAGLLGIDLS
jgi:L-cysteine:1D-myo-inositol 2-amino-2-deoxy-alpha-D-glucopyranoside ligase